MNCKISHLEYFLPEKVVSNEDLKKENPSWDVDAFVGKTGVLTRHIAKPEETALDLAEKACQKILVHSKIDRQNIDGIIFCTQSPDYILPPNATLLHDRLKLNDYVLAFDINLACSGYLYGLAIAKAFFNSLPPLLPNNLTTSIKYLELLIMINKR